MDFFPIVDVLLSAGEGQQLTISSFSFQKYLYFLHPLFENYFPKKRHEPPYKNHSVVELKQSDFATFESEHRGSYLDTGKPERREAFRPKEAQVHLGDDPREVQTQ